MGRKRRYRNYIVLYGPIGCRPGGCRRDTRTHERRVNDKNNNGVEKEKGDISKQNSRRGTVDGDFRFMTTVHGSVIIVVSDATPDEFDFPRSRVCVLL